MPNTSRLVAGYQKFFIHLLLGGKNNLNGEQAPSPAKSSRGRLCCPFCSAVYALGKKLVSGFSWLTIFARSLGSYLTGLVWELSPGTGGGIV